MTSAAFLAIDIEPMRRGDSAVPVVDRGLARLGRSDGAEERTA